jgi:outer membrane protein TolC
MSRNSRAWFAMVPVFIAFPLPQAAALRAQERPILELSLQGAVERALENNVDIAVQRFSPIVGAEGVRAARGAYDPLFTSTLGNTSTDLRATSSFDPTQRDFRQFNFGLAQEVPTGASLSLTFNNSKTDAPSPISTFNPVFNSSLTASFVQPLLRDFRIDAARQQLKVAKKNREISDLQFHQTVVNTVAGVKSQYYDFLYAIDNLEAQKKSLALAKKFLEENQIKVRVGTMAPLDVVAAESEVAAREEAVIVAEAAVADTEDALKRSIFPKSDAETWAVRIVPTDRPTAEPIAVDVEAAIRTAIEKRTDVNIARRNLEKEDVSVQFRKSQTLPAVDLVASYGTAGVGGTFIDRGDNPLGPPISTTPGGYGDAVSEVFGREFPTWTLRINVSYPILNRSAAAASAQARVIRDQALASLRRLEMDVATEIRTVGRAVETSMKRVESTRAARVLRARQLEAEEKKFAAGMSTNFQVTQAQRDLALAEVAELRAIADYRKSIVRFEQVQETGIGGGGGLVSVSTGSAASAAQR